MAVFKSPKGGIMKMGTSHFGNNLTIWGGARGEEPITFPIQLKNKMKKCLMQGISNTCTFSCFMLQKPSTSSS